MKKWILDISKIYKYNGKYWILPCISIWYDKYHFLETGVKTPAFGLQLSWINFTWGIILQEGYK